MSSTATQRLRFDKQATGDNPDSWGERLNAVLDLIDEAIAGVAPIVVNANVSLVANNFITDQARRFTLVFTGPGGFAVTVPSVEKAYLIANRCTEDVTIKTPGGAGAIVLKGTTRFAYCDGTQIYTDNTTGGGGGTAATTSFTPTGTVTASNVQDAIVNLAARPGAQVVAPTTNVVLSTVNTYFDLATLTFTARSPAVASIGANSVFMNSDDDIDFDARIVLDDMTASPNQLAFVIGPSQYGSNNEQGTINHDTNFNPLFGYEGLTIGRNYRLRLQIRQTGTTANKATAKNASLLLIRC